MASGLPAFPLSHMHDPLTLYSFGSPKLPRTMVPPQFYAHEAAHVLQTDGAKEGWTYIALLRHMFHCPIRLKLPKNKFRGKMIKNSTMMAAEHESQHRPF